MTPIEIMARALRDADPEQSNVDDWAYDAQAAITALEANGYAIVPVEPSRDTLAKGYMVSELMTFASDAEMLVDMREIYRAMIAAKD